jgi:hypothetical protein
VPLHILKLCVGIESIDQLARVQNARLAASTDDEPKLRHITRHRPRQADAIVDGGSLYWVITGFVQVRQRIIEIVRVDTENGKKCAFVLDPTLVATEWQPRRPHQGWRYLRDEDTAPDLDPARRDAAFPDALSADLRKLGLL